MMRTKINIIIVVLIMSPFVLSHMLLTGIYGFGIYIAEYAKELNEGVINNLINKWNNEKT